MNYSHIGTLQRLCMLLLHVLVVAIVLVPIRSEELKGMFQEDVWELKNDLEMNAREKLSAVLELTRNGLLDEAEATLRDAIALAPWIPDGHRSLAHFLLGNHQDKKQVHEILHHFRSAMQIDNNSKDRFPRRAYPGRLKHDRDQLALLGERGKIPRRIADRHVEEYDKLLSKIPHDEMSHLITLPWDFWPSVVGSAYDWALYVPEIEPLKGPALNPSLDFAAIEKQYLSSDPHYASFDNILTEEALMKLRKYYEEATVFWDGTGPGYVGSYLHHGGFGNPVIGQLIEELIEAFPGIICSHRLRMAWAYKYDSEIADPIATHADEAAVNFNFWVSPDEGNLDKDSGGLVVYKAIPPIGTPREVYNAYPLDSEVFNMLNATGYANYTIPFQSNRAVVFQSNLFHASGQMRWAKGYTKRRLNLTFLFGQMYGTCEADSNVYRGTPVMNEEEKEL